MITVTAGEFRVNHNLICKLEGEPEALQLAVEYPSPAPQFQVKVD